MESLNISFHYSINTSNGLSWIEPLNIYNFVSIIFQNLVFSRTRKMIDGSVIVVMVMLSLFSICGTIGNSLVLYIYSNKKEKSTAGIFIMSLAGTDLFTCLFIMPYTEALVYLQYYLRYDAACKIYMFFITCNIPFAAFIMVAIAMDRYFCICHPFLHVLNIQRAKIIVLCLLFIASTFGVITALSHGVYSYSPVAQTPDKVFSNLTEASFLNENSTQSNMALNSSEDIYDPRPQIHELYKPLMFNNVTDYLSNDTGLQNVTKMALIYHGFCIPNSLLIKPNFLSTYQIVYAGTYILSFIIVVVLYGLIYRSIHAHRAKRSKRKRSSLYPSVAGVRIVYVSLSALVHSQIQFAEDCICCEYFSNENNILLRAEMQLTEKSNTLCFYIYSY